MPRRVNPQQPPLPDGAHAHDLPPYWDGRAVRWHGWREWVPVTICPPPKDAEPVCAACGAPWRPLLNTGVVTTTLPAEGIRRLRGHATGPVVVGRLTALRCPACHRDQILDWLGQLWDLDADDYSDDGSTI